MLTRWSRLRFFRGGPEVSEAAVAKSARPGPSGERPAEEVAAGDQDPLFEGGGSVLLRPAFWEKAGWGIAVLVALTSASPAGAFPRTSSSPPISLHGGGR
jgi:hypothetical protein